MTDIHKHCPVCNTPIPLNETTCSEKCQGVLTNRQASVRKNRIVLFILMIVFIIIFMYMMFFRH